MYCRCTQPMNIMPAGSFNCFFRPWETLLNGALWLRPEGISTINFQKLPIQTMTSTYKSDKNSGKGHFKPNYPGAKSHADGGEGPRGIKELSRKNAVKDFKVNKWNGNESDQMEYVRQWLHFNSNQKLTIRTATGRNQIVSGQDVLTGTVPSPFTEIGAEPLPNEPDITAAMIARWNEEEKRTQDRNDKYWAWWNGNIGPGGYFETTMTSPYWIETVQRLTCLQEPVAMFKYFETRSNALGFLAETIEDRKWRDRLRQPMTIDQSASDFLTSWMRSWQESLTINVVLHTGAIEHVSAMKNPDMYWTNLDKEFAYRQLYFYLQDGLIPIPPSYRTELNRFDKEETATLRCYSQKIAKLFQMFTQASVQQPTKEPKAPAADTSKNAGGQKASPAAPNPGAQQPKAKVKLQELVGHMTNKESKIMIEALTAKGKDNKTVASTNSGRTSASSLTSTSSANNQKQGVCHCDPPNRGGALNCQTCLQYLLSQCRETSSSSEHHRDGASLSNAQARDIVAKAQQRAEQAAGAAGAQDVSRKRKSNFDVVTVSLREVNGMFRPSKGGDITTAGRASSYKLDSGADWTIGPLEAVDSLVSDIQEVDSSRYKAESASGHELVMACSGRINERWPRVTLMSTNSYLLAIRDLTSRGIDVVFPAEQRALPHGWYASEASTGLLQDVGTKDYYVRPMARPISAVVPVTVQFPKYPVRDFSHLYNDTATVQLKSLVTTAGGGIEAGHAVVDTLDDLSSTTDTWEDIEYQYDSDSASAAEEESSN